MDKLQFTMFFHTDNRLEHIFKVDACRVKLIRPPSLPQWS